MFHIVNVWIRGQPYRSQFSLPTMWALGVELTQAISLGGTCLYPKNHLTRPITLCFYWHEGARREGSPTLVSGAQPPIPGQTYRVGSQLCKRGGSLHCGSLQ